jgi:hypothetical protein
VTQALDDGFEIHGDHRLVLDDQHVGGHLCCDLAPGNVDQRVELGNIDAENLRRFGSGKALHRAEQEGLARQRSDGFELAIDHGCGGGRSFRFEIDADRVPQTEEGVIKRDARIERIVEQRRILDQDFEGRCHVSVAGSLGAGQGAGEASEIRKMRRDRFRHRHAASTFVLMSADARPHISQTRREVAT